MSSPGKEVLNKTMTEKKIFCSQCKMSKYADTLSGRRLYCSEHRKYYPIRAMVGKCEMYDPERKEDAMKKAKSVIVSRSKLRKEGFFVDE